LRIRPGHNRPNVEDSAGKNTNLAMRIRLSDPIRRQAKALWTWIPFLTPRRRQQQKLLTPRPPRPCTMSPSQPELEALHLSRRQQCRVGIPPPVMAPNSTDHRMLICPIFSTRKRAVPCGTAMATAVERYLVAAPSQMITPSLPRVRLFRSSSRRDSTRHPCPHRGGDVAPPIRTSHHCW